jgi:hypothetical protein
LRRALTLIEALLALALALVVIAVTVVIASRGAVISGRASAQLALAGDARTLIDNLVADVHAALYLEEPAGVADFANAGRIVIHRSAGADPQVRLERNAREGPGYPFLSDKQTTAQHLDVRRVVYTRAPDPAHDGAFEVHREETGGFLTRTFGEDGAFTYSFAADAKVKVARAGKQRMAGHLTDLKVAPLALVRDESAAAGRALVALPDARAKQDQACVLLVALALRMPGVDGPDGRLDLTSKIWISEKLLAFRFPEFFSSVDENLAY